MILADGYEMHLGDCVEGMRALADKSVDVVITDPPYEAEAHTKGRRTKRNGGVCVPEVLPFAAITSELRIESAWHMARLAKRWMVVFCQTEAARDWASALENAPFGQEYIRTMVWVKPDGQPQFTGDRPGVGYESIVVAHPKGRKRWNGGGRTGVFTCNKNAGRENGEPAPHPTTKPLPLMRELVELFTDPGNLVLDAFAGSGTTGVACRQLGRRFIGFERDPGYFEIACRRIRGESAKPHETQLDLLGGVA